MTRRWGLLAELAELGIVIIDLTDTSLAMITEDISNRVEPLPSMFLDKPGNRSLM